MKRKVNTLIIVVSSLLLFGACDDTFYPWQENEQYHFSIYGYLDASVDTQWVRVMPVREDFFLDPDKSFDVTVTLEHIESGETAAMNDSLFSYAHGAYAWNFWTTKELYPEQKYRLSVEDSDGRISFAEVTLPEDYPTPYVVIYYENSSPKEAVVFIDRVDRLADVQAIFYHKSEEEHVIGRPHLKDTLRMPPNDLRVIIDIEEDYGYISTFFSLDPPETLASHLEPDSRYNPQIFIASAGPDYHHFPSILERIDPLPEGISNVVHGVGYLAGIVSKTIPYKNCFTETNSIIPCDEIESPPW